MPGLVPAIHVPRHRGAGREGTRRRSHVDARNESGLDDTGRRRGTTTGSAGVPPAPETLPDLRPAIKRVEAGGRAAAFVATPASCKGSAFRSSSPAERTGWGTSTSTPGNTITSSGRRRTNRVTGWPIVSPPCSGTGRSPRPIAPPVEAYPFRWKPFPGSPPTLSPAGRGGFARRRSRLAFSPPARGRGRGRASKNAPDWRADGAYVISVV